MDYVYMILSSHSLIHILNLLKMHHCSTNIISKNRNTQAKMSKIKITGEKLAWNEIDLQPEKSHSISNDY